MNTGFKNEILKISVCIILLTYSLQLTAQPRTAPVPYSSNAKVNYVRTWEATAPEQNANYLMIRALKDVKQTTQYFDGLGLPLQLVIRQGSMETGGSPRDFVSAVDYDDLGREQYKYLPFAANNAGGNSSINDGFFKLNPFQQDSVFCKAVFSDESYYYSKTSFEASPLNRALENYAPGDNWVGTAGQSSEANRHGVKIKYWINTNEDSVRLWRVTNVTNSFGTYTADSIYHTGQLYKTVTQDENNKQVIEFKDKEGKIILKKVQLTAASDTGVGKNHTGWLCTYYIYDDLDNLRCVVQPKGVELLVANSWNMNYSSGVILAEQCFRYEYDNKRRMIMKKVPGAGIVYLISDVRNRVVMVQDSLMRASHKWTYTLYDALNRDTATGLITDNSNYNNAAYHRSHADTVTNWPDPGSYTNELLTKKFYDSYDWRGWESNPLSATRNTSYDSYLSGASDAVWPYPQTATVQSNQLRNILTGTKTKILGTGTYLYSVNFYDDKGRPIQIQSTNITEGTDISTTQYSWVGQPLLSITKQENAGTNAQTSIILTRPTYDSLWRVIKTEKKISTTKVNSGAMPSSWTTISENEYNALGQLKKKNLGAAPVDSLNYEYNIRGWMLGMNRSFVKDTTSTDHWFGFDLGYDKTSFTANGNSLGYTAAQYNGNIGGMLWRSNGDDVLRKYDFTYDAVNRLTGADFNQLNDNSFSKTAGIDFSVSGLNFDANGNILNMNQKGWKLGGSSTIDSLVYGYISNSNKLNYVTDRANDAATRLGDFRETSNNTNQDYSYDGNGNMVVDSNKKITNISYNYLNLPDTIVINYDVNPPLSNRSIIYTYDAVGNKLKKEIFESPGYPGVSRSITTLYLNGLVFETKLTNPGGSPEADDHIDSLQFIPTEEGRARINKDNSAVVYDYMVKDHLGNVRMLLTEEKDTAFYPAATLETATLSTEELYYSYLSDVRVDVSTVSDYPANTPSGNQYVAKCNIPGRTPIGPGITLKVMAGDKFNLTVNSWWKSDDAPNYPDDLTSYLTGALNNHVGGLQGSKASSGELAVAGAFLPGVGNFFNSQNSGADPGLPWAFVNWILFDEQFNFVSSNSGFEQVDKTDTYTTHVKSDMPIDKSGFLYIYVSNATDNIPVYFDNLQVTHIKGPLLEETHYYPFGLIQAGISSEALGSLENKKSKYNGYEYNTDFNINLYESFYRSHDPQIGRFLQPDPKPTDMESLYTAMGNNPIKNTDLLGDTTIFYTASGVELLRTTENNKELGNVVTFVPDNNLKAFNGYVSTIGSDGGNLSEVCSVQLLRGQGESYNVKSAFDLVDGNVKNYTPDKAFSPTDGKGPLINETSAAVEKKGGVFTVNPAKTDPNNQSPFANNKVQGDDGVTIHTHDNEGRKFKQNSTGKTGWVESGPKSVGDDNSTQQPGTGLFEMAVSKNSLYFYNNSGVVVTINRDVFNSKYFRKQ